MTITTADLVGQFNIVVPMYFLIFYFQQLDMLKYKPIPTWLAISGSMVARLLIFEKALALPPEDPIASYAGVVILILAIIFLQKGSYAKRILFSLWALVCMYISLGIITITLFGIYGLHNWTELIDLGLYSVGQTLSYDTLFAFLMLTCIAVKMKHRNMNRDIVNISVIVGFSVLHFVVTAFYFSDYSDVQNR